MRRTLPLLAVVLGATGCAEPAPRAPSSETAPAAPPAATRQEHAARDPALSGVVRREIEIPGAERYEIEATASEPRSDFVGIVKIERRNAAPFTARLTLTKVFHDAVPWTVRAEMSRFDADMALPALKIGETVEIMPIVWIA